MSSSSSSFSKLKGTTIFVKTFPSNSTKPFVPFVPSQTSSSITCSYDTTFTGNVTVNGTFTNPSDAQLKTNIQDIPSVESDKVMDLSPITYQRKSDSTNAKHYGLIAQDVEHIFPELVQENDDLSCKTINYLELIPLMISKMQKMQMQIDELMN